MWKFAQLITRCSWRYDLFTRKHKDLQWRPKKGFMIAAQGINLPRMDRYSKSHRLLRANCIQTRMPWWPLQLIMRGKKTKLQRLLTDKCIPTTKYSRFSLLQILTQLTLYLFYSKFTPRLIIIIQFEFIIYWIQRYCGYVDICIIPIALKYLDYITVWA